MFDLFDQLTSFAPRFLCSIWDCRSVAQETNWFPYGPLVFAFISNFALHMAGFYPFCWKLRSTPKFSKWRLRYLLPAVSFCPALLLTGYSFSEQINYGGAGIYIVMALIFLPGMVWSFVVLDPIDFPFEGTKACMETLTGCLLSIPVVGFCVSLIWWTYSFGFPELFGYMPMEKTGWRKHLKYFIGTPFAISLIIIFGAGLFS